MQSSGRDGVLKSDTNSAADEKLISWHSRLLPENSWLGSEAEDLPAAPDLPSMRFSIRQSNFNGAHWNKSMFCWDSNEQAELITSHFFPCRFIKSQSELQARNWPCCGNRSPSHQRGSPAGPTAPPPKFLSLIWILRPVAAAELDQWRQKKEISQDKFSQREKLLACKS